MPCARLNVELSEHGLPTPPRQRDVGRSESIVTQPAVLFELDRWCRVYVRDERTPHGERQNHGELVTGPHVKPIGDGEPAEKQKPDLLDYLFLPHHRERNRKGKEAKGRKRKRGRGRRRTRVGRQAGSTRVCSYACIIIIIILIIVSDRSTAGEGRGEAGYSFRSARFDGESRVLL